MQDRSVGPRVYSHSERRQRVKSSRAGRPTIAAEVPQEADGIAAAQRTGNECQYLKKRAVCCRAPQICLSIVVKAGRGKSRICWNDALQTGRRRLKANETHHASCRIRGARHRGFGSPGSHPFRPSGWRHTGASPGLSNNAACTLPSLRAMQEPCSNWPSCPPAGRPASNHASYDWFRRAPFASFTSPAPGITTSR
jgi:hypothetical protein